MAYSLVPSAKWQEILNITDEKEQGIAATQYVCDLEHKVATLEQQIEEASHKAELKVVDSVMKNKYFKEWIDNHDRCNNEDWSGTQGGF